MQTACGPLVVPAPRGSQQHAEDRAQPSTGKIAVMISVNTVQRARAIGAALRRARIAAQATGHRPRGSGCQKRHTCAWCAPQGRR